MAQVHDPVLGHAARRVEPRLDSLVAPKARVTYLDDHHDVLPGIGVAPVVQSARISAFRTSLVMVFRIGSNEFAFPPLGMFDSP